MSEVKENLSRVISRLPEGVELVAVSKFHHADLIMEAYQAGQRIFGESRVMELLDKIKILPEDIRWHFIGHLQTNKVRKLIGHVHLIESVDSERLLDLIDSESRRIGVITNVLMQVHVAREETKFGFYPEELAEYFNQHRFENLTNVHICGIMGMASNTDDMDRVRDDFKKIHKVFSDIRNDASLGLRGFNTLSMGMSGDWEIAVKEGSNLVRIGSAIFGNRQY